MTAIPLEETRVQYVMRQVAEHIGRERLKVGDQLPSETSFGENRLHFSGPDGDSFALVEAKDDRAPWAKGGVPADQAIRGFHSASLRLRW